VDTKMANDVFQNIGKAIGSPIGNLVQGAYRGLAPGVYEQESRRRQLEDLQKKIMILQQLPQGSPAQIKFARNIMEQHGPEIMKGLPRGSYQPFGMNFLGGKGGISGIDSSKYTTTHRTGPFGQYAGSTHTPIQQEMTPVEKLSSATGLRKEFNADKAYKDFQTIKRSESTMNSAYKISIRSDTKSRVASDQALAVCFQKMLDPDSVVRESEYARTPEGVSMMNKILAYIPQLQKGGLAISDEDRKAMLDIAKKLLEEGKRALNSHIERYETVSRDYGINPRLVLGNIKRFEIEGEAKTMSFGQLFEKYKDVLGNLNQNQMNIIDKAWQEAVKDDVPAQEFVDEWLKLRKGLK